MQSTSSAVPVRGLHVAILMGSAGRPARATGALAGAAALLRAVRTAPAVGIETLIFCAGFDGPGGHAATVHPLLQAMEQLLRTLPAQGVRVVGPARRDWLPVRLVQALETAEIAAPPHPALTVRLVIDTGTADDGAYSWLSGAHTPSVEGARAHETPTAAPHMRDTTVGVDLLIHTGGHPRRRRTLTALAALRDADPAAAAAIRAVPLRSAHDQRLGEYLLRECSYADLHFAAAPWERFDAEALRTAVDGFRHQEARAERSASRSQRRVAVS